MKLIPLKGWAFMAATALVITFVIASNKSAQAQSTNRDTVPKKTEKKVKDLDEAMLELEKAQAEVELSLKNIDLKKIEIDLQESMKKLELDMAKMKIDIDKSMKEIDVSKIKLEVDEAMAKVDWQKIEKELEKVKEIDLSKIKVELENIKPELDKAMKEAEEGMAKAKAELKEYQAFIDGLEKDGLIDKKKEYLVEHRDGQLLINGQVQPAAVYNKYKSFLDKHKKLSINKTGDNFSINND